VQFALHDIQQVAHNIKKACVPTIYTHWLFSGPGSDLLYFAY
jgi:hypothetical protein